MSTNTATGSVCRSSPCSRPSCLQQTRNSLAVRRLVTHGLEKTELVWTIFGFTDDDEAMTERRLQQANLIGPAGYISMEDGAAPGFVQRGVNTAADVLSVVEMGGRGIKSDDTRVTEASVRGFWTFYRSQMGSEHRSRNESVWLRVPLRDKVMLHDVIHDGLETPSGAGSARALRPGARRRPAGSLAGFLHRQLPLSRHHRRQCRAGHAARHDLRHLARHAARPGALAARRQRLRGAALPPYDRAAGDRAAARAVSCTRRRASWWCASCIPARPRCSSPAATTTASVLDGPDGPRFVEKTVVLDSRQIDTLLAIPI